MRKMQIGSIISTMFLAACLALVASPVACAQHRVKQTTTADAVYSAGSPEHEAIKAWLMQHSVGMKDGLLVGDFDKLDGALRVVTSTTSTSGGITTSPPGPPVPLPVDGSNGDTISVSSCGGGVLQRWSYVWAGGDGGGWQLKSYSINVVQNCEAG